MNQIQMKECLRDAWKEVFQVEDVADDVDFFEAGGDSVMAVQLSVLLAQKGVKLDLADVFTASTFGRIAEKLIETEAIHIPDTLMEKGTVAMNEKIPDKWRGGASKIYENETGEAAPSSAGSNGGCVTNVASDNGTDNNGANGISDSDDNNASGTSSSDDNNASGTSSSSAAGAYATPEDALAGILSELIPNFDQNEDLFAQGLTSFDAVKVVSKCEAAGYKLELKDIYMHSTFDELLEVLKK